MPIAHKKITAWSFSRWSVYHTCPLQAKLKFIDKLPDTGPPSPAMARGDAIHKQAQAYILSPGRAAVPRDLKPVEGLLKTIRAQYRANPAAVVVEDTWAYKRDWSQTTWNDWAGCWLRIKMDCAIIGRADDTVTVQPSDWKTGKFNPQYGLQEYMLQTELYALGALHRFKNEKRVVVTPQLVYTDHNIIYPSGNEARTFTLADLKPLTKQWENRVKPMLNDTAFKPTPSSKCGWCPYSRAKGGPCVY